MEMVCKTKDQSKRGQVVKNTWDNSLYQNITWQTRKQAI